MVLPAAEEEHPVAANRSTGKPAVLLALQEVLVGRKEVLGGELTIPQIPEQATVQVVGPRSRDRVDDGAGAVALRGAVVAGLNAEFLERVRKRERLILLVIRVGVAGAVETERDLPRLGAVGRHAQRAGNRLPRLTIHRRQHHAGDQGAQGRGVAAVERELDDALGIDDLAERGRRHVHQRRFS
jgi:hypothetical protein